MTESAIEKLTEIVRLLIAPACWTETVMFYAIESENERLIDVTDLIDEKSGIIADPIKMTAIVLLNHGSETIPRADQKVVLVLLLIAFLLAWVPLRQIACPIITWTKSLERLQSFQVPQMAQKVDVIVIAPNLFPLPAPTF